MDLASSFARALPGPSNQSSTQGPTNLASDAGATAAAGTDAPNATANAPNATSHAPQAATTPSDPHMKEESNGRNSQEESSDRPICLICYEPPKHYAILSDCDHPFCYDCVRSWREAIDPTPLPPNILNSDGSESESTKRRCPVCRAPAQLIFCPEWVIGTQKKELLEELKRRQQGTPCTPFEVSKRTGLFCPYGDDCFFRHTVQGTDFQFNMSAVEMLDINIRQRLLPTRRQEGLEAIGLGDSQFADAGHTRFFGPEEYWTDPFGLGVGFGGSNRTGSPAQPREGQHVVTGVQSNRIAEEVLDDDDFGHDDFIGIYDDVVGVEEGYSDEEMADLVTEGMDPSRL